MFYARGFKKEVSIFNSFSLKNYVHFEKCCWLIIGIMQPIVLFIYLQLQLSTQMLWGNDVNKLVKLFWHIVLSICTQKLSKNVHTFCGLMTIWMIRLKVQTS